MTTWLWIELTPKPDITAYELATIVSKTRGPMVAGMWCRDDLWNGMPESERRHFKIAAIRHSNEEPDIWPQGYPSEKEKAAVTDS